MNILPLILAVSCNAAFIRSPATNVRIVEAMEMHVRATSIYSDISGVKLYLESVVDTRSQQESIKTAAKVMLQGLKYTDSLEEVVGVLVGGKENGGSLVWHLEQGHTRYVLDKIDEEFLSRFPKSTLLGDMEGELVGAVYFDGRKEKK